MGKTNNALHFSQRRTEHPLQQQFLSQGLDIPYQVQYMHTYVCSIKKPFYPSNRSKMKECILHVLHVRIFCKHKNKTIAISLYPIPKIKTIYVKLETNISLRRRRTRKSHVKRTSNRSYFLKSSISRIPPHVLRKSVGTRTYVCLDFDLWSICARSHSSEVTNTQRYPFAAHASDIARATELGRK